MSRGTQTGPTLVKDLQGRVKLLTADLRERSEQAGDPWAQDLRAEYDRARERERTGLSWSEWRDGEVDPAAVAWVLATVFVRFCEDNGLIDGPWITGEGPRHGQAADNETAFYQADPTRNSRDWLRAGFAALADLPAGRDLLDPRHNLVWRAPISADAASALLGFWRTQNADGTLVHDFTDDTLDTRFLGDLYQDLSDFAKKKYALLQTPVFVEEFILDRTLTPAMEEFGLDGLKLIDPTCGSGHFLLGAFDRLLGAWQALAPAMDTRERVQNALDSIHGVDLNPFAVAIARFRLTVAALEASGLTRLQDAPAFDYHLAVGDSLLYGYGGTQGDLLAEGEIFTYTNEDVAEDPTILDRGRYHVVVGNPPYINVKDKALNEAYRAAYSTCKGKYALTAPFMELFFALAIRADGGPAGYVGQITSNSFMKREFGKELIEELLSGRDLLNPVDLTTVIDSEGVWIPGHNMDGTPTVIIVGRRRHARLNPIRAVLSKTLRETRAEGSLGRGPYWTAIVEHIDDPGSFDSDYVTITDLSRDTLARHPWSLTGGGAAGLKLSLDDGKQVLGQLAQTLGVMGMSNADDVILAPQKSFERRGVEPFAHRQVIIGEAIRDFSIGDSDGGLFLYTPDGLQDIVNSPGAYRWMWPARTVTWARATFSKISYREEGRSWWEWHQVALDRLRTPLTLTFAFVATHNHFVLDRGGKMFSRSAPVIKLPPGASEDEHLDLLGVLNSSVACFWMKQTAQPKGGATGIEWSRTYEFTGTKLQEFPLPKALPRMRAHTMDDLARQSSQALPSRVVARGVDLPHLNTSRVQWCALRTRMIFQQEELDWEVYWLYGLTDENLTYTESSIEQVELGQRAFEIALARKVAEGTEETAWFERHGSTPITEIPAQWPEEYRALVQKRLDLIASDPFIGLLERPEYKRRWNSPTFDDLLPGALRDYILDRLEDPSLWSDAAGPGVLSVAQLADRVRGDADLVEAVRLLRGAVEIDLTKELGKLLAEETVPYLAALRYKDSGLRKRAEWESVWDLQRREDAGETVSIPVPPKYGSGDFRKTSYWKARGKLDVPKERFISYPGAERPGDSSMVIGWAGWDHLDQARALARLIAERTQDDGLAAEQALPLVAGLVELEPWLHQWHSAPDSEFGGLSPAVFLSGFVDSQLAAIGKTRADAQAWRP